MSPEQVRGLPVDHRSDIFSFGTILYEMLSGKRAFRGPTAADTMAAILKEEPSDLSESGRNASPALDHIVKHCLEKDQDNRFQSARDLGFALSEALAPQSVKSGLQAVAPPARKSRILTAAVVIAVLAAAGIFLLRRSHEGPAGAGSVVAPAAVVEDMAVWRGTAWVLDEEQRALLLRLTPSAFDDDRGLWGLCLAQAAALNADSRKTHQYAEEARRAFEEQLRNTPEDAQRHVFLGLALAYLGRKEEAIREGERGVSLSPVAKDAEEGPYFQYELARIYTLVGEPEKALDQLDPLLKIPSDLSPGWLKIDPNFDPLRKNPRFQRL